MQDSISTQNPLLKLVLEMQEQGQFHYIHG
jgi:hypothetical protein